METIEPAFSEEFVVNKILIIRGLKVMLDSDLAELYGVETRRVNEQVRRNPERFPPDFMFQLSEEEYSNLMSQFATSSWGGRRKLPLVFTEHGVLMLSSVLSSAQAIAVNIQIMRVFTKLRQNLSDTGDLKLAIEDLRQRTTNNSKNIELVFQYLDELLNRNEDKEERTPIGYRIPG